MKIDGVWRRVVVEGRTRIKRIMIKCKRCQE